MSELTLPVEIINAYQALRSIPEEHRQILCYGPHTALDFDHTGDITVCCHNRQIVLGSYPHNSIQEAWHSQKLKTLRAHLAEQDFSYGCELCYKSIAAQNYSAAGVYCLDSFYQFRHPQDKPTVFVFEFSNICNLECIMCGGKWSSAIRTNREKLPNYKSPYDDTFVEEVKKYLPDIQYTNFVGGEPFLEPLYYKIWKAIAEINPEIQLRVTTNGTVLNEKIKILFSSLPKAKLLISLDSLNKHIYESIRVNASFEQVLANIQYWLSQKKVETILVCPMIPNWKEIPEILRFCEENNVGVYFNTVNGALGGSIAGIHQNIQNDDAFLIPEFSLSKAPRELLLEIIKYYQGFTFSQEYQQQFNGLINLLRSWAGLHL
jgi:MoaA/NifB/PqqE/SkfB family radical SAM enzyme